VGGSNPPHCGELEIQYNEEERLGIKQKGAKFNPASLKAMGTVKLEWTFFKGGG
jgi:hypothetical protein